MGNSSGGAQHDSDQIRCHHLQVPLIYEHDELPVFVAQSWNLE